jgi:hypothetical protein
MMEKQTDVLNTHRDIRLIEEQVHSDANIYGHILEELLTSYTVDHIVAWVRNIRISPRTTVLLLLAHVLICK